MTPEQTKLADAVATNLKTISGDRAAARPPIRKRIAGAHWWMSQAAAPHLDAVMVEPGVHPLPAEPQPPPAAVGSDGDDIAGPLPGAHWAGPREPHPSEETA